MFFYYLDLAVRSIKRTPFVSGLMVLALAAGVGLTITMLSVYLQLSNNPAAGLKVQPYAVQLQTQPEGRETGYWGAFRQVTYRDAYALTHSDTDATKLMMFKSSFAVKTENPTTKPVMETVRITNGSFFKMWEMEFIAGSVWSDQVDKEGGFDLVIAESLATQLFGNKDAMNQIINLDGKPYRVVGIVKDYHPMPKLYDLNNDIFVGERMFIPISLTPTEKFGTSGNNNSWKGEPINTYEDRLASEILWLQQWVSFDNAQQKEQFTQWVENYIAEQKLLGRFQSDDPKMFLRTPEEWLTINDVVDEESTLMVAISALFLVICIINTIGLLLGKFFKGAPAVGTRRALGASQAQIFSQHIVEVALIGAVGAMLGLVFAFSILNVLDAILNTGSQLGYGLTEIHWTIWFYAPAISIAAAVIAGIIPAWRICRMPPSLYLKIQ